MIINDIPVMSFPVDSLSVPEITDLLNNKNF